MQRILLIMADTLSFSRLDCLFEDILRSNILGGCLLCNILCVHSVLFAFCIFTDSVIVGKRDIVHFIICGCFVVIWDHIQSTRNIFHGLAETKMSCLVVLLIFHLQMNEILFLMNRFWISLTFTYGRYIFLNELGGNNNYSH